MGRGRSGEASNVSAMAGMAKALASADRLRIMSTLAGGESVVSTIQAAVAMSQASVSQHLGTLREAGLVLARREGRWVHYRLSAAGAEGLMGLWHATVLEDGAQGTVTTAWFRKFVGPTCGADGTAPSSWRPRTPQPLPDAAAAQGR